MTMTIAISGKGGSGKTTIAAMIIRTLLKYKVGPILAVDADPNSCLGLSLGVQPEGSIAQIREHARSEGPTCTGMDKLRTFEYGIQQAVTEAKGFDLLTMGGPEGPACYCAANNMLRKFLDRLSSQYRFVIIDNEAGMEHLSRRTTNNVDLLCVVAEPTVIGALTAERIYALVRQLPISVEEIGIIWNKADDSFAAKSLPDGIETIGHVPEDDEVFRALLQGDNIFDIDQINPAVLAVEKIVENRLKLNSVKCASDSHRDTRYEKRDTNNGG